MVALLDKMNDTSQDTRTEFDFLVLLYYGMKFRGN